MDALLFLADFSMGTFIGFGIAGALTLIFIEVNKVRI